MKSKRLLYIAGKVTGEDIELCKRKFLMAEMYATEHFKTDCFNPLYHVKQKWSWLRAMLFCVFHLLKDCNSIFMLQDWKSSRGAKIEHFFAKIFRMNIIYQKIKKH